MPSAMHRGMAEAAIDAIKGRREKGADGADLVGVKVSRSDIESSFGRSDAQGRRLGDESYGNALAGLCAAVRQPVYDGDFKRTGEVRHGAEGVAMLHATFGQGHGHRTLWMDREAMIAISAGPVNEAMRQGGLDAGTALATLCQGARKREDVSAETRAAARPARAAARANGDGAER